MDIPQVLAAWIHTLAFVIVLGYYGILGRVVLPALERTLDGPALAGSLASIERRALPLVLLAVGLFVVTGTYLLVIDTQYAGLGNVFASTWTTLMLVKHGLVVVLVVLGALVDWTIRDLADAPGESVRGPALTRVRRLAEGATAVGALVILLTAAAQIAD